ncbi:MATE family efflux transporter [Actinocorallia sp. A-T 12471]|uniref:MATE family efflux transporter n=1 Tax=Actinocorallia sp. A-T 12471 TaxID=3089813 RepID=UPI0029D16618|nr:MATE family efflux transporter [Actinocorallia sp. A-T 12471]MDX6742708.1 MATE family efflux transporter [Actinocorallia sp. A-T 12471]
MDGEIRRENIDGEILRLAIPAFFALVAEPLFLLSDAMIVGRLGTAQQAGLTVAGQAMSTVVGCCVFLAYATTAAVARQVGAGRLRAATRQGVDGIWLALLLGALIVVVGLPTSDAIVGFLGGNSYATEYLRVALLGAPGMLIVLAGTGILRGLQNGRFPLVVSVAMFAANLVLNVLFVLVLEWGIAGSAWGTVAAQTGGGLVYLYAVASLARRHGSGLRPDLRGLRTAAASGFALVIRTVTLQATLVMSTRAAAHQGTDAAAAYGISSRVWLLSSFLLDAVAIAGQSLLGRHLGAGEVERARAVTRRMLWWGLGAACAFGALLLATRTLIPPLFDASPGVASLLTSALVVVALIQPLGGLVFVLDGVLIGAGDMRYLAWAGVATLAAFVPAVWLAADHGIVALWLSLGWWMLARLVTLGLRARSGRWLVTGAVR